MEDFSLFDIIGPRMTGPSSSHTAGAVRIGYVAGRIIGSDIDEVRFTLYGSFAETGKGHGTDKALVAGILGFQPDDVRISDALKLAREKGICVDFAYSDEPAEHPNTVRIDAVSPTGKRTEVLGRSIGGGNILITEINNMEVELTGEYPTIIVQHDDVLGVIADVSRVLAQLDVNIAYMRVFRHGKGRDAFMCIETDTPVTADMLEIIRRLCSDVKTLFTV